MISSTLCAIIFPAPVVQALPLERRSARTSVFETGLTRARHEPAIGATKSTRLVGLRRSLARSFLTGRRIRAAAESVEVFIDQTSHQSTVRRHAIRLQRPCGGNQRRPRSLRLDGVASTDQ